ncbi:hypothetical protein GSI_08806 [Ganoderma sinense ZZ0214-1]|uniref:Protein-S-isoprenylcysteine O-methyltransferase n=1 Tax=Ganoderma sinense ZZ0214-1 TaxID=1077348 RepID=A0A2G8S4R7_9APHY|nr:hypothetical protein GSI_08806 [Ganoderma sinense ZZ0214-1]
MSLRYLLKVPAFALIMVAEKLAFYPPTNLVPKGEELAKFGKADGITRIAGWFPTFGLVVYYTSHLCEVIAILAREYPSPLSQRILSALFTSPSNVDRLATSPIFVLGFLLLVIGGIFRKTCYDTLGKYFTFQLAVLKEHKLITSGLYSYVRHPSYTAFVTAEVGLIMVQLFPGSYIYESGMMETWWTAVLVVLWGGWVVNAGHIAVCRVPKEDAVLRAEFGVQWDEWANRTPYKLVPYIY